MGPSDQADSGRMEHHLASFGAPVRRLRAAGVLGGRSTILVAALLFGAVFVLSVAGRSHADAPLVLLVAPVALLAVAYGLRGGVAAAAVAVVLATTSLVLTGDEVSLLGYISRGTAFVVVGILVGRVVDQRRALLAAIGRHQEMSLDALATIDFDGFFRGVNPAWTRIFGYTKDELLGRAFVDFVHPDDLERTVAEATRTAASGADSVNFRNRYRAKNGSYRWLEWVSTTVPDERLFYAVARDITAKKQAEDAVEWHRDLLERAVRERTRDLEAARLETLRRLAYAAEYRDDQTYEHTERVGRTAALLAERLHRPEEEVELIRQAAPLHDVGKLGISDTILLKPGKLTPAEFELMKTHALVGARILAGSTSPALQLAEEIALTHHEWWDGCGYPHGLKGTDIPLSGRIVAVADVFDALTQTRPYKAAWPVEEAVDEIRSLAGRQFDPDVVAAFEQLDAQHLLEAVDDPLATAA
jgi:PAS domain S-box-containing protein